MSDLFRVKSYLPAMLIIAAFLFIGQSPSVFAQKQFDANAYTEMKWRMIGPFRGGRVNGVSGVPNEPNTFYFGS
ncbi:MAG: hypothetical protein ACR2GD_08410, partial [Pyrinomonadaceae bacterium]